LITNATTIIADSAVNGAVDLEIWYAFAKRIAWVSDCGRVARRGEGVVGIIGCRVGAEASEYL